MIRIGRMARLALAAACVAVPVAFAAVPSTSAPATRRAAIRVGVYDGRALAMAWFQASNTGESMQKLSADAKAAQAAGDQKRYEELRDRLERMQFAAHVQVFSDARPEEALAKLAPEMAAVAREMKVAAIASRLDYSAADVETVDVTEALVARLNPPPDAKQIIEGLRRVKPVPLFDAARAND